MKIRQGFVSNSSSSSFLIYGTCIDEDKIKTKELLQKIIEKEEGINDLEAAGDEFDDDTTDILEVLTDLEVWHPEYVEAYYMGLSWSDVKDDETGRQFKDRVEAKIKEFFPTAKFGTHEEAWRDG